MSVITQKRLHSVQPQPSARPSRSSDDRLLKSLGWFSAGLGISEVLMPSAVARVAGVGDGIKQRTVVSAAGARELVHAAGLLTPRTRPAWVWTRVAGDAMDLAALSRALHRQRRRGRGRTVATTAAIAGVTVVDVYTAARNARRLRGRQIMELTATTTIRKQPGELYDFWRRFENLPGFMAHLEDVRSTNGRRSHWRATAPFGRTVEWDAEIIEEIPGQQLSWCSLDGADIRNTGTVELRPAPGGRGTEVHVELAYEVPAGPIGAAIARWAGEEPHQQLDDDLRRLKQVMETGEVVRSDGAPGGKSSRREFPQHPARPLTSEELAEVRS